MFTRQQMKSAAKLNMNKNMARSIGVALLAMLPSIILSFFNQFISFGNGFWNILNGGIIDNYSAYEMYGLGGPVKIISDGIGVLSLLVFIFVTSVTYVGMARYFLKLRGNLESSVTEAYSPYREGIAGNIIKVVLITGIFIVLGFIVIVPGIIFAFRFAMVKYVLAVNPTLSGKRAREISTLLMKDHWAEYFVLCLSFIGWFILGGMTGGILLVFYVTPYYEATTAEFYSCCRAELVGRGGISPAELPSFGSDWYSPYNPDGPFGSFGFAPPPEDTPPVI